MKSIHYILMTAAVSLVAACTVPPSADEHPNVKPKPAEEEEPTPPAEIDFDEFGGLQIAVADYQRLGLVIAKAEVAPLGGESITLAYSVAPDGTTISTMTAADGKLSATYTGGFDINKPLSEAVNILFYLPIGSYAKGFDITLTDTQGRAYTLPTGENVTIEPGETTAVAAVPLTLYYGTANCYRTAEAGTVKVDITPYYTFSYPYAYEGKTVGGTPVTAASASVVWQQTGTGVEGDVLSGEASVSGNELSVPVSGKVGNAVVAIKDTYGTVLWSYHIWVSESADVPYNFPDGYGAYTMMDRNLGATSTEIKNQDTYGDFYQWVRKDAFMRPHNQTRPTGSPYYTDYTVHESAQSGELTGIIAYTIQSPGIILKAANDRHYGFRDNALWGNTWVPAAATDIYTTDVKGIKTVYDPCPAGYRIPDYRAFDGLEFTSKELCDSQYGHVYATGVEGVTSYYPTAGFVEKNVDNIKYLEYRGYYWTNIPGGTGAYSRMCNNANGSKGSGLDRAVASSVRCLKMD